MKVIQTTLFGATFELETENLRAVKHGDCDRRCLEAEEEKCVCRCGGRNHGILKKMENASLDGGHYIYLDHIPEIRQLFEGYVCPGCGASFKTADLLGYEHPDGLYVKNYDMRLWVFARCRRCSYDTAWWKLGRALVTTPEGWP